MQAIKRFFQRIFSFFSSGKAEEAFNKALVLIPQAQPIVSTIALLTPNRTDDEIAAAYESYAVPYSRQLLAAQGLDKGMLLLNLATEIMLRRNPGTPMRIIQLAIQAAYVAWREQHENN